jgi:hypothetical protein
MTPPDPAGVRSVRLADDTVDESACPGCGRKRLVTTGQVPVA